MDAGEDQHGTCPERAQREAWEEVLAREAGALRKHEEAGILIRKQDQNPRVWKSCSDGKTRHRGTKQNGLTKRYWSKAEVAERAKQKTAELIRQSQVDEINWPTLASKPIEVEIKLETET